MKNWDHLKFLTKSFLTKSLTKLPIHFTQKTYRNTHKKEVQLSKIVILQETDTLRYSVIWSIWMV